MRQIDLNVMPVVSSLYIYISAVGHKCLGLQDPCTSHRSLRSSESFCLCGLYPFDIYYIKIKTEQYLNYELI